MNSEKIDNYCFKNLFKLIEFIQIEIYVNLEIQ